MYQDPAKNAMAFQSYVQLTMLEMHQASFDHPVKVMERSIHSARWGQFSETFLALCSICQDLINLKLKLSLVNRHCFVENLYNAGFLASVNRAVLDEWYKWICETQDVNADLIGKAKKLFFMSSLELFLFLF